MYTTCIQHIYIGIYTYIICIYTYIPLSASLSLPPHTLVSPLSLSTTPQHREYHRARSSAHKYKDTYIYCCIYLYHSLSALSPPINTSYQDNPSAESIIASDLCCTQIYRQTDTYYYCIYIYIYHSSLSPASLSINTTPAPRVLSPPSSVHIYLYTDTHTYYCIYIDHSSLSPASLSINTTPAPRAPPPPSSVYRDTDTHTYD